MVVLNLAAIHVDDAAGFDVDRAALAACDVVAGDLAAVDDQRAARFYHDRAAAGRRGAAGEFAVLDRERAVFHIRDAAPAAVDGGALDCSGSDAVVNGQRRAVGHADMVIIGDAVRRGQRLAVQTQRELLPLTEQQLGVDSGEGTGQVDGFRLVCRDGDTGSERAVPRCIVCVMIGARFRVLNIDHEATRFFYSLEIPGRLHDGIDIIFAHSCKGGVRCQLLVHRRVVYEVRYLTLPFAIDVFRMKTIERDGKRFILYHDSRSGGNRSK